MMSTKGSLIKNSHAPVSLSMLMTLGYTCGLASAASHLAPKSVQKSQDAELLHLLLSADMELCLKLDPSLLEGLSSRYIK